METISLRAEASPHLEGTQLHTDGSDIKATGAGIYQAFQSAYLAIILALANYNSESYQTQAMEERKMCKQHVLGRD